MHPIRPAILATLLLAAACGADTVVTRDGKTLSGKARIEKDHVTITPPAAKPVTIPLDNLASLTLDAPAPKGPPPATQPSAWTSADVGLVRGDKGLVRFESDRITLLDSAAGLRGAKNEHDSLFFFHQKVLHDATLVARLRFFEDQKFSRAGIAIRSSLAPDAPMVALVRSRTAQSAIVRRSAQGSVLEDGDISQQRILGATFLKLQRKGYTFTASESTDGVNWQTVGAVEVPMPEEIFVGLAAANSVPGGGRSVFDRVCLTASPADPASVARVPRGLITLRGSCLACDVTSADDAKVDFLIAAQPRSLPLQQVARIVFTPLLPAHHEKLQAASNPGVLLINGDFLDGEIKAIRDDKIHITSVLFGARAIDTRREAAAVALRPLAPAQPQWHIDLANRSSLAASRLTLEKDTVKLTDPILGDLTLPAADILSLKRP